VIVLHFILIAWQQNICIELFITALMNTNTLGRLWVTGSSVNRRQKGRNKLLELKMDLFYAYNF